MALWAREVVGSSIAHVYDLGSLGFQLERHPFEMAEGFLNARYLVLGTVEKQETSSPGPQYLASRGPGLSGGLI